jgi:hypothetical protein
MTAISILGIIELMENPNTYGTSHSKYNSMLMGYPIKWNTLR